MLHFKCDKTCTFKNTPPRKCAKRKMKWKQSERWKIIYGGQWVSTWYNTQSVQFQIHTFIYTLWTPHTLIAYSELIQELDWPVFHSLLLLLLSSSFSLKWRENFIAKKISNKRIPFSTWKMLSDLISAFRNGQFIIKLHP